MDESAIKGLDLNGSDLAAMRARRSPSVKIVVKGYDTWVSVDCVESELRKHFSSCGEIVCVSIAYNREDRSPKRVGYIYILGDGAEEKALQLNGSEMKGRKLVVTSPPPETFVKLTPEMSARLAEADRMFRSEKIVVRGYDTSLPEDDIKSALTNHFSSCGEIVGLTLFPEHNALIRSPNGEWVASSSSCDAVIYILGEGAEEKALQLSGSDMGGCKLVVVPYFIPPSERTPLANIPRGYTIPARCAKLKKKKKKRTDRNRKKTRK